MVNLYCDDGDLPPRTRPWNRKDRLTPEPPRDWIIATVFNGPTSPLDIAAWLFVVGTAQMASRDFCSRRHRLARDPSGQRVLLVHPAIQGEIDDANDIVHGCITQCSCGGMDCLEPKLQEAAAKVLARRKWTAMSAAERIDFMVYSGEDADIGMALEDMETIASGNEGVMFEVAYH